MAVPSSGTLEMKKMAQEALHGTYGSGTINYPISLYDMTNGGNTNGSGDSYPAINTSCTPNPAQRTAYLALTGVDEIMGSSSFTLYYNASIGNASNLAIGDRLYTDCRLETAYVYSDLFQPGSGATTTICGNGFNAFFGTDSNGDIDSINCQNAGV